MNGLTISWPFLVSIQMRCLHCTLFKVIVYQHCCMAVKFGTWTIVQVPNFTAICTVIAYAVICRKSQYHGRTVSDVFFHAVGEKALNHYNIFAIHCQYHTFYTSANYGFRKSCIALILLFYSHYFVACIRRLLLLVVCRSTMCSRRNCLTTQLRTDLRLICHVCGLVIWVILFVCWFMFLIFA